MVVVIAHFNVLGKDGSIILKWILEIIICEFLKRIVWAQDREKWRDLLKEAVNVRIPQNDTNSSTV
jgi:hypothetical protein